MQELIYCLDYVHSGTHGLNEVDIEVEMVSVCVICVVRTVKVWITFCGIAQLIQSSALVQMFMCCPQARPSQSSVSRTLFSVVVTR